MKADDKVQFEGNKPEKYTEFELLVKKVEVMQETIDEIAGILRANELVRTEKIDAPYVDEDEIFGRLA
jgi:hypothetical protein